MAIHLQHVQVGVHFWGTLLLASQESNKEAKNSVRGVRKCAENTAAGFTRKPRGKPQCMVVVGKHFTFLLVVV